MGGRVDKVLTSNVLVCNIGCNSLVMWKCVLVFGKCCITDFVQFCVGIAW